MIDHIKDHRFSLCQYKNITHLYLSKLYHNDKKQTIDYISKFNNLERLIIETTTSIDIVKDIITNFPLLKVDLKIFETKSILCNDIELLDSTDQQSLDFIHVDLFDMEDLDISKRYQRVNSIQHVDYLSYSDILSNKSLQHIGTGSIWLISIINVVKDNDHIISFSGTVPLSAYGLEENEECDCIEDVDDLESFANGNKLEHWLEFCKHLATNRTLKTLNLFNSCSPDSQNYHILEGETLELVSDALSSALESNKTLQHLTIPCGILTKSFFSRFSDINQTIRQLCLIDAVDIDFLYIAELLKNIKTNIKLRLSFVTPHSYSTRFINEDVLRFLEEISTNQSQIVFGIEYSEDYFVKKIIKYLTKYSEKYNLKIEEEEGLFSMFSLNK